MHSYGTRLASTRHNLQLEDPLPGQHSEAMHRSIFLMVSINNLLSGEFVSKDVRFLQCKCQDLLKEKCFNECRDRELTFTRASVA